MAKLDDLLRNMSSDTKALNPDLIDNVSESRRNKFGAQRAEIDDIRFDSKKEALRYLELKSLEAKEMISNLKVHPTYELVESFHDNEGNKVSSITYTPDFKYDENGHTIIEDVKGGKATRTEAFSIRWRLLQHLFREATNVRLRII